MSLHTVAGQQVRLGGWKKPASQVEFAPHRYMSAEPTHLPQEMSFQKDWVPVWDQGQAGTCSANETGELIKYNYVKVGKPVVDFSRLFQYYVARVNIAGGDPNDDSGCSIHDAVLAVAEYGACPESLWQYDDGLWMMKPPAECYPAALEHRATSWRAVPNLHSVKTMIANYYPVGFGFEVHESMMTDGVAVSGMVPMPGANDKFLGGHAVTTLGYSDAKQAFLCVNSWGVKWGLQGFFWLPYGYFEHGLASDAHVILRQDF